MSDLTCPAAAQKLCVDYPLIGRNCTTGSKQENNKNKLVNSSFDAQLFTVNADGSKAIDTKYNNEDGTSGIESSRFNAKGDSIFGASIDTSPNASKLEDE